MFTSPDQPTLQYPRLKGKAAELRHLTGPLLDVWESKMTDGDPLHESVRLALQKSLRAEEILDENSHHVGALSPEDSRELIKVLWEFILVFQRCNSLCLAMDPPKLLFSVTIKAHVLLHCALQSQHLNPVNGWTFRGEDFQQIIRKLVESSARGNKPHSTAVKITSKWTRATDVALRGQAVWINN